MSIKESSEIIYRDIDLNTIKYEPPIQKKDKKRYLVRTVFKDNEVEYHKIILPNLILYSDGIYDKNKLDLCALQNQKMSPKIKTPY